MNPLPVRGFRIITASVIFLSPIVSHGAPATLGGGRSGTLTFCCVEGNDLYQSLVRAGARPARADSAAEAIDRARDGSGVLMLADHYPVERTRLERFTFAWHPI